MTLIIAMARDAAQRYLENISVDDVLSLVDCSTTEAEQIVHLIQVAEIRI